MVVVLSVAVQKVVYTRIVVVVEVAEERRHDTRRLQRGRLAVNVNMQTQLGRVRVKMRKNAMFDNRGEPGLKGQVPMTPPAQMESRVPQTCRETTDALNPHRRAVNFRGCHSMEMADGHEPGLPAHFDSNSALSSLLLTTLLVFDAVSTTSPHFWTNCRPRSARNLPLHLPLVQTVRGSISSY